MKRIYNPIKKKTILIVDDDQVVVHLYREKFHSQRFKLEVVDSAAGIMQRLKQDTVDLVILDLCLPGVNGIELLKNIRSEFEMQALPVIAFSNAYLGSLARSALEAGATKCVTKGDSTPGQMLELVRELLPAAHSTESDAASDITSPATGTLVTQSEMELQEKLVATILMNAPETLARLRTSHQILARTEPEDLRKFELRNMHRQVRSLAGSAGLPGLRKIAQMANALEGLLIELHAKPSKITPSVVRTLAQAIDTLASLFDRAPNSQTQILVPPKILVVDDEIISRETICSALAKANLLAISLDDSLVAQRLLEQDHFNLIFLDVEMPGQSGLELCVSIREMAANSTTPVVFVTAHSDFGSRAKSTLSGGNDFIAKPFLLVELAVKALTWLFKETPSPLVTATSQNSAPVEAACHESHLAEDHAALSFHEGSGL